MSYKAVIFDLDGTLLDTLEDIADSMNEVLKKRNYPVHDTESYLMFIGSGAEELVARAMPENLRSDGLVEECLAEFREIYHRNWNNKTRPYDGVLELLDTLTHKGVRLAVLSNKPQEFTDLCMQEYFSKWQFDYIHGQRKGVAVKPDPEGALSIAGHLNLSPADIVFLGDSDVDMLTALNAGMYPAAATWGFRSEDELREAGGKKLLDHPLQMLDLFL